MHLEVITEGPASDPHPTPILFVHGMWHGAWCWAEHFLPYFARHGYVSHALSLRGHGDSEGRARLRWTSLNDYVTDVAREMENAPLLVGHSRSGGSDFGLAGGAGFVMVGGRGWAERKGSPWNGCRLYQLHATSGSWNDIATRLSPFSGDSIIELDS